MHSCRPGPQKVSRGSKGHTKQCGGSKNDMVRELAKASVCGVDCLFRFAKLGSRIQSQHETSATRTHGDAKLRTRSVADIALRWSDSNRHSVSHDCHIEFRRIVSVLKVELRIGMRRILKNRRSALEAVKRVTAHSSQNRSAQILHWR